MSRVNILGVNVDKLNKNQVDEKIRNFLNDNKQHFIVTPNPEIILAANYHDDELFYILSQADLAIPDGIGLKFAAWLMGENIHRLAGADLVKNILKLAQEKKLKLAIINWSRGLSKKLDIEKSLKQKFSGLEFLVLDVDRINVKMETGESQKLKSFQPQLLFCALGAPFQEKFIYNNLKNLPTVRLAMPVGSSFDYLSGKIKRAPRFMRFLGLEWLWRLIYHPADRKTTNQTVIIFPYQWRWQRIYQAVIIFPYKFFLWRFIYPHLYRPNVACLLYKKEGNKYNILIAERREENGHWQLPQGGTDGEDLISAGTRELSEEISTDKFKPIASYKNLYKYLVLPEHYGNFPELGKKNGYKGQKQGLFIAEFLGDDNDITINYWDHQNWKWVDSEKLVETVFPFRQQATKIFLNKFKQTINKK